MDAEGFHFAAIALLGESASRAQVIAREYRREATSVDRAIASNEVAVVRWLLEHAKAGEATTYKNYPVEQLRVLDGCNCGCSSLDFQPNAWGGAKIIADALGINSSGKPVDLILWGRDGQIVLLEIVNYHPAESCPFPNVSELRAWEQRGLELL